MDFTNGNGAPVGRHAGSEGRRSWQSDASENINTQPALQARHLPEGSAPIRAELTGSDTCRCGGITATGNAPVLALCRQLLAAGLNPDQALEVYRGATLALRISNIGKAAKLTVRDNRHGTPVFRRFESGQEGVAAAPPIRKNGRVAP